MILGWVTYAAFYLGRVNLATALPAIQVDLHFTPDEISALAGATLWTYAIGQLVNGWLGNRVDTRRMVLFGIVGSTIVNLLFAASSSLPVMVILWLINGFLQSMGWGPVLRTLSAALEPTQRQRIAGAFGASYVVGNTLTWALTGLLLSTGQWRLMEDRSAPLLDPTGAIVGSCGAARDVTDRQRHEAELAMAERMAAVGTLSASIVHELNNPLMCVLAGLDQALALVDQSPEDARLLELLGEAREGATRMRSILRDLLDLTRPASDQALVDGEFLHGV